MTDRFLTVLTDQLEALSKISSSRNPSGTFWGVVVGSLIYGIAGALSGTELISLWIAVPTGLISMNAKAWVSQIKGEPEFDERISQALKMIEKYASEGAAEADVRRLYQDLSLQLIRDAGQNVEIVPPHKTLAEAAKDEADLIEGQTESIEAPVESIDPA